MNFKQFLKEGVDLLPKATIKVNANPNYSALAIAEPINSLERVKVGSLPDSEKFYNNIPVKIIPKTPDTLDQIWVSYIDKDTNEPVEIQVKTEELKTTPYYNNSTLPVMTTPTMNTESAESKPEDILKNAFSYFQKNEHKLKELSDIEMFKKIKDIMTIFKKTKHLTSQHIEFLKKEVAPLFEDLLLGNEKKDVKESKSPYNEASEVKEINLQPLFTSFALSVNKRNAQDLVTLISQLETLDLQEQEFQRTGLMSDHRFGVRQKLLNGFLEMTKKIDQFGDYDASKANIAKIIKQDEKDWKEFKKSN